MRLSVVIVNWNARDHLRDCLASLAAQSHRDLEILVVDNGSRDGSTEMAAADFPAVRVLRSAENLGFAEGCNRGFAAATGPWIATLNNDAVAEPDWAAGLVEAAAAVPPDCGMLQSLMLYRDRPAIVNCAGLELNRRGNGVDRWIGQPRPSPDDDRLQEIFCPSAGAAAYRREMLEAIRLADGYFDPEHFMYSEDLDLGWRARLAGWTARYVPNSVVLHTWHGSVERHGASWLETIAAINRIRTLVKNASVPFLLRTAPLSFAYSFVILRRGGFAGVRRLAAAVRRSVRQRAFVATLARVSRADVERLGLKRR